MRRREGAEPWVFYEGPPTANGRPGAHHVLARVFKDIYPRYKTMRGHYVERKGGWDCHGLPVEITVEKQLGLALQGGHRGVRHRGVQRQVPRVGVRVPRGLERADRAHRLLGRPRRRLPHAGHHLRRVGLVGAASRSSTRTCSTKATRSCPTARAAARALSSRTSWRWATRTSSTRRSTCRFPVTEARGPLQAGDELLVWTTTPWTLVVQRRGRGRPRAHLRARADGGGCAAILAEALVERVLGRGRRDPRALPGRRAGRHALRAAVPLHRRQRVRRARPHRPARRLRHRRRRHRPRAHRDRLRRGRLPPRRAVRPRRSSTPSGSTEPTTSASGRTRAASSRTPTPTSSRTCGRAAASCARRSTSTPTRTAGAAATPLLYYAKPVLVHRDLEAARPPAGRQRAVNWHPEHVKHGRFGNWLENNVDWALSRERYWGTPLPIWRCEAEPATSTPSARFDELEELSGVRSRTRTGPTSTTSASRARSARARMRRVPEVIDVWFDSGAMPFAQYHAPFENEERFEARCPARLHLRGARPDPRLVLLAARRLVAAVRPLALRERRLPRPDPRRRGQEDVQVPGQHRRARGRSWTSFGADAFRWYFFTSKQPWDGYQFREETVARASGCSSAAVEHLRLLRPLRRRREARSRPPGRRPSSTAGCSRAWPPPSRRSPSAHGGLRRDHRRAARSPPSSTICPTGTCAARAGASGTATRPPSRRCTSASSRWRSCWRRSRRSSPTRSTTTSTASEPSVHLADWPAAAPRDVELEQAWPPRARRCVSGWRRAARRRSSCASRCARPSSSRPAASARRSSRLSDLVRDELNVKALRFVERRRRARLLRDQAQLPDAGPAVRQGTCPRSRQRSPRWTPSGCPWRCARAARSAINVDGHDHELDSRRPARSRCSRWRATSSSARARTPWRWTWPSTTSCGAKAGARDRARASRTLRKDAGLDVSDRIDADRSAATTQLLEAARAHEGYVAGEVLATSVSYDGAADGSELAIDGRLLRVVLTPAS